MVTCGVGGRNKRGGEVMDEGEDSGGWRPFVVKVKIVVDQVL